MNKAKANFDTQTIYVGMDVHKASWNLGIYLNDVFVKNVHQKPNPQTMVNYLHCCTFALFLKTLNFFVQLIILE
jgi:hypothetical protein